MATTTQKAPPGVFIWVSVTLLWGTLFFFSSVFMLNLASLRLGHAPFNPSQSELFSVYGIHASVLVLFALAAMMVKQVLDPGSRKQLQRWQNIEEGKGEKLFISFAGSLATSFFFTGLTAATFLASSRILGFTVDFTLQVVFLAALFNIAAGIAASVFVGIVFLVTGVGRKKG